jgi:putative effector of murein hydrolase LrgA (UPF0299 family)
MSDTRKLDPSDRTTLVLGFAIWGWMQQYLPSTLEGSITAVVLLWTVAYGPVVRSMLTARRYWLFLPVAVGCIVLLSVVTPFVPYAARVWSTVAMLAVATVGWAWTSARRRRARSQAEEGTPQS